MKIANFIRAERAARRCSQLTLARLSGLSRYLISLFENGYREPTKAELLKIKTAFNRLETDSRRGAANA